MATSTTSQRADSVPRAKQGYLSLLHTDPVVLYAWDSELREPDSALWSVLESIPERPSYLVVSPSWTLLDRGTLEDRAALIRGASRRFPRVTTVTICPTEAEVAALGREGLAAVHCSEGALVRDDFFTVDPDRRPRFDAIYDAKWADYKRQELAGAIRSLALIAPPPWSPEQGFTIEFSRRAHAAVRHATWISRPWGGPARQRWLSPAEINAAYNQARVGLCLSSVEGLMAASIQYLLAGLPVVTTRNVGGRDEFFDPAYVRWVEDDPGAVADAVDELVGLGLDPDMIRKATLAKMAPHRVRLQAWIRDVILAEGGEPGRWSGDWPDGLPNKLREPQARVADLAAEIDGQGSRPPVSVTPAPRRERRERGLFTLLHADPVVLCGPEWEVFEPDSALWSVLESVRDRPAYLVVAPHWTLQSWNGEKHAARAAETMEHFEHLRVITCCPTLGESVIARRLGLEPLHCSGAAFVREDRFTPLPGREPQFDAIYDAQWADYKRHDLAGGIRSLALIAPTPWSPSDCTAAYFQRAHAAVRHATWLVSPWRRDGGRRMSSEEVNAAYSRARVGLCLSRIEAFMFASLQYLLAGLPVVTTPSLGGRDEFFDPAYVRWADADPGAVADAVEELAGLDLDPEMIREATLAKIADHRARLQNWIRETIVSEGGEPGRWGGGWPAGLPHKLREPPARAADVIAQIHGKPGRRRARRR